jgi:hypothetical protein
MRYCLINESIFNYRRWSRSRNLHISAHICRQFGMHIYTLLATVYENPTYYGRESARNEYF